VEKLLKAADVTQLHYGGGVSADEYDWQTNTDISGCPNASTSEFSAPCAYNPALPFSEFSANARALGAQSFVTVKYGSGTPALAAAWVAQATSTAGQGVADWEIGNESYGCWENNNELADAPEDYQGYEANVSSTCPMDQPAGVDAGMEIMADSYAANAEQFMVAMKAADPSAQLGVPWAFSGAVGGAGVQDNSEWNDTVLGDDAQNISFVDAHFYPFAFGGDTGAGRNPTAQTVIQSVENIPTDFATIRATLNKYDPTAQVIVGETGVSYRATNVPCTPTGALFAAGGALEWLAAGAQSVDWWPLDTDANLGTKCAFGPARAPR
jgi:alpha-L-arabinofuranosidase